MWVYPCPERRAPHHSFAPLPFLLALLVTALGVVGHVYNETLDPWNLNKNQGESLRDVYIESPLSSFLSVHAFRCHRRTRLYHFTLKYHLHSFSTKLAGEISLSMKVFR